MTLAPFGAAALNQKLVGEAGSRFRLETPAAVLDLDLFERNIALLAETCRKAGLAVRPHAKSHKCAEIARQQMAAGALGICCAKPGELLALFEGGIRDLLLSAPIASPTKIDALARAAAAGGRIGVVVDRADLAIAYGEAARRHGAVLDVLIDLDVGLRRSGVATPAEAVDLAKLVSGVDGLRYRGVQAYQGRVQHIDDFAARRAANQEMGRLLAAMIAALRQAGFEPQVVSGGGTGSHLLDGEEQLLTEIQAGSYVFMDEAYNSVDMHGQGGPEFEPALRIAVTVIGHSSLGFAITDGGSKSFALDGPPPRVFLGGELVGRIEWCGDEFGRILPREGQGPLPIGTVVECTVPHCDPTINLHDFLHVASGDRLIALWHVEARGRAD
ncbi:DSD1 family PLP-dependent enzyme [Bosea sp. BK604]|uniref:DSD1 family PLP-dependent enzyme n=1 Tax=Bosea sp. BK604 TaxID=2512180 RepID=UPI00104C7983|nr:DSD1 family PLP-dependent enzyme [Bosea sp. BK604]TCR67159.1 D-serine deaminase-like pyridoxal phosphate-dependent protein [Bosea sp. BK604]